MHKKYVIAVSGGVDSMYLATKMSIANQAAAFVHINHHTRGIENDKELKLVKELGALYQIPVYVFDYHHESGNFQSAARTFRYQQLVNVARKYDHKIATAHHLDDQLENCLIPNHLVKSNLMTYRSRVADCHIYRPLLGYRKSAIYQMAADLKVKYNEDVSNRDSKYQRNKCRQLLTNDDYLQLALKNYIVQSCKMPIIISPNPRPLDRNKLITKPKYYQYHVVYQYIKSIDQNATVKNKQLQAICNLMTMQKNSKFSLANCNELFIGYGKIYMLASDETIITESILKIGKNEFNGIEFDSETDQGRIRTINPGDRVKLLNGHKKVSRIFIDNKLESHMRKRWPLVTNNNGEIVFIPKIWRKNEID